MFRLILIFFRKILYLTVLVLIVYACPQMKMNCTKMSESMQLDGGG